MWSTLSNKICDAVLVVDPHGLIEYASPSVAKLLDRTATELRNQRVWELAHPRYRADLQQTCDQVAATQHPDLSLVRLNVGGGQGRWIELAITGLPELLGDRTVWMLTDVHAQVERARRAIEFERLDRLREPAASGPARGDLLASGREYDPVTGLPCADIVVAILDRFLARATSTGVLLIDLSCSKTIETSAGRQQMEALMAAAAHVLCEHVDTDSIVGRWDDTALIVAHEHVDTDWSTTWRQRLHTALQPPLTTAHGPVRASVDIGVAVATGGSSSTLIATAVAAARAGQRDPGDHVNGQLDLQASEHEFSRRVDS